MFEVEGKKYVCYMDLGMELIRGKWKAVILCHLDQGPKRFLELQRCLTEVSHKVLNEKLKELEKDGLIHKEVFPEMPPKVMFSLTEKGVNLFPGLRLIEDWAKDYYKKESLL